MVKYLRISSDLEQRLQAGAFRDGRVPSVREVAEEYAVSALTASRALQVLQSKGLVRSVARSGTFVAPAEGEHYAVALRVSPTAWSPASAAVVQSGLDALSAAGEATFVPWPNDADPARHAARLRGDDFAGVFLLPSRVSEEFARRDEALLAACRAEGLPVVLLDRNLRGENRPLEDDLVCSDHLAGGRVCTDHLLGLGRRRIACVVASPCSAHEDREAGYRLALAQAGRRLGRELPAWTFLPPEDLIGPAAFAWLADRVEAAGVDGILCYQDYVAVGLLLELFRRGRRVPDDVAVVGCDNLPIGQALSLGVTTYAYPGLALAEQALRLARARRAAPTAPPVKILVPGTLIVRESTVLP